jgi:hypothetical protein
VIVMPSDNPPLPHFGGGITDNDFADYAATTVEPRRTLAAVAEQHARVWWGKPASYELEFAATLTTDREGLLWDEHVVCHVTVSGDCDGIRDTSWHRAAGDGRERISQYNDEEREALETAARTRFYEHREYVEQQGGK